MSGEVEVPKTPEWLKTLEEKRERRVKARLGHEAGAGAPCLKCGEKCPGLDLHFWRKNCKICRCSKEDHDTHDDDIYSWAQFELLGSKPNKIKTKIVLPGKKDEVELEWAPKGQKDTIDKYLKTLPPEKIPVKGSQAAQERKQALQKQIPIHDIDPSLCHELNEDEVQKMNEYIAHVKKSSVGVGQIVNLSNVIKANLHNISPHEAHIIASRYSKGVPYTELVKMQAGLARNLEKLAINDPKNKSLPNMQPRSGFGGDETVQNPLIASKMRDVTYQNYLNSNPNNLGLNPQYSAGLPSKNLGVNSQDQVPFDYNIDDRILQGTNFDPSKTPSQFKGFHTQGYRPQRPNDPIDQDDMKLVGALQNEKVPFDVSSGENLNNPNASFAHFPGSQQHETSLPYNQVRQGFKPCGIEHHVSSNSPNYSKTLTNPHDNQAQGYFDDVNKLLKNTDRISGVLNKGKVPYDVTSGENLNNPSASYSQQFSGKQGYKPCGIDHHLPSINQGPNLSSPLNEGGSKLSYNKVSNQTKLDQINSEINPSQLPLYAQNMAAKTGVNPPQDSENYGFENPLFNNPKDLSNFRRNSNKTESENQNPMAPKNMKDLIYSTHDPNNTLGSPEGLKNFGVGVDKYDDPNLSFDQFGNINTQHGSLGYVPGINTDQIQTGGSIRHPLLDKYGNVESNPAYTGELGNPQLKSGPGKVSGLKNLFESHKGTGFDPRQANRDADNNQSASYDPKTRDNPMGGRGREGILSHNPPIGAGHHKSAFYDPRVQNYDSKDPRNLALHSGHPNEHGLNVENVENPNEKNKSAFYDPRGQNYNPDDPRLHDLQPGYPNVHGLSVENVENPLERNPSAFYDPKGQNYDPRVQGLNSAQGQLGRNLPQMQPSSLNISEEYMNPNQVNIGLIRDINYPDNEIKEAMIATNPEDDFYGEDYSPDSIKEILNNIILPNCHYCKKPFEENEFAVTIERANVLFHAECFKCAGCNQSLADNIYFYHKESNNVYCGRDYAKIKGYPRCNACDELIFTKEYCLAENATFHLKHFCCFQCDTPLAGKEYTLEDEQPYCLPCFELTKASKCSTCQNVIKPDERGCNLNGVHFHAEDDCFACIVCKKPLMGQKLLLRNEKLYCSHDCFNSV